MKTSAIKTSKDIKTIQRFLCKRHAKVGLLFTFGLNTAMRISDLRGLKFTDIVDNRLNIIEGKTNKKRLITLNTRALEALSQLRAIDESAIYLFQATGNRVSTTIKPLSATYIRRIIKEAQDLDSLNDRHMNLGTHSLRKTFGYHQYQHKGLKLGQLMTMFNHSSEATTLAYIGVTDDDIANSYLELEF